MLHVRLFSIRPGRLALGAGLILSACGLPVPAAPASAPASGACGNGSPDRPNIVFILADDLGWSDLGCRGSEYALTPNIDRLAREGLDFRCFYASQNCAPTRASLMTGQYAPRTGVYTVGTLARGREIDRKMRVPRNATRLPLDRVTVAQVLREAGYVTAMFGKWHLGEEGPWHPARRGFDEAVVSAGRHLDFTTSPPVEIPPGTWLADFLTDRAVDFIERHRDRPFFLYLPHFAVHAPLEARPDLLERFRSRPPAGGHAEPVYAAMIAGLDGSVGRLLACLDRLGLAGRTVVIFSSDNGGVGGYRAAGIRAHDITDNRPLRAGKGTLYEGGIRVPFIVRWPGTVPAGSVSEVPAAHVDVLPTLVEIGRAPRPAQPLDGVSLLPVFRNPRADLPRDALFWHFPGYLEGLEGAWRTTPVSVLRQGDLKLMEFLEDGRLELYDLRADPGEHRDLAALQPEAAGLLHRRLAAWRTGIGAAMPTTVPAEDSRPGRRRRGGLPAASTACPGRAAYRTAPAAGPSARPPPAGRRRRKCRGCGRCAAA